MASPKWTQNRYLSARWNRRLRLKGTWSLEADDFESIGRMIGSLRLPTLIVQEGGYDTRVLGINARHFCRGWWSGAYSS